MGCGRVGSRLARDLDADGHSVAIIDQSSTAFGRLPESFQGLTVEGVGFDRDTLERAGIARAAAFAAVSSGDNSNIISARVAREQFNVDHVVARIYDPRRAEIYQRLGIPTVATVAWTTAEIMHRLLPTATREEWRDASGQIALGEFEVNPGWIGKRYSQLARIAGISIAGVGRYGQGLMPNDDLVVQQDDRMHATYPTARTTEIEALLATGPEED